ncbi:HAD family hydrolase [Enterococcus sp. LJL99]
MAEEFKGIIFDMDGVLVDSEQFYYQRRKDFLSEYDLSIDHLPIQLMIGADMRSLWDLVLKENDCEHDKSWLNEKYQEYKKSHPIDYTALIDEDAKQILRFLKRKKFKVGLASSSSMDVIEEVLKIDQLSSYFDLVVSGTQFEKSKPEPDIYLYAVAELGLEPAECIAIEDSERGILAAKRAGLTVWALQDTQFNMDQKQAQRTIVELSDICKILQEEE